MADKKNIADRIKILPEEYIFDLRQIIIENHVEFENRKIIEVNLDHLPNRTLFLLKKYTDDSFRLIELMKKTQEKKEEGEGEAGQVENDQKAKSDSQAQIPKEKDLNIAEIKVS